MDIGKAIKMLRSKRGLTQSQLAERCFMSANAISSLETGKHFPPQATIDRLSAAFGISRVYMVLSCIEESDFPEDKRILYRTQLEPLRHELLNDNQ